MPDFIHLNPLEATTKFVISNYDICELLKQLTRNLEYFREISTIKDIHISQMNNCWWAEVEFKERK
jgi:hypothetical protein